MHLLLPVQQGPETIQAGRPTTGTTPTTLPRASGQGRGPPGLEAGRNGGSEGIWAKIRCGNDMEAGSKPVSYTDYSVDSVVVAREGDRDSNTGNPRVQKLGPGNSASLEFGTFERKRISRPALRLGIATLTALCHSVFPKSDLGLVYLGYRSGHHWCGLKPSLTPGALCHSAGVLNRHFR